MSAHWKELVLDKRTRQAQSIPRDWLITPPPETVLDVTHVPDECGLLTTKEIEITNTTDVAVLLSKLASSEWSSVEVTTAFYKRAIVAQQVVSGNITSECPVLNIVKVNCLTEIFVERALARAAELDTHLRTTGSVVGPLHGLPISLKDQLPIKGLETTMGAIPHLQLLY